MNEQELVVINDILGIVVTALFIVIITTGIVTWLKSRRGLDA